MPEDVEGSAEAEVSGAPSESENDYEDHDHDHDHEQDHDHDHEAVKDEDEKMTDQNNPSEGLDANGEPKKKYDPKDPSRPRRKKARRACYACQRAHLTCGDERPCQRCIKRGLADACQDGVRKKAKYLHDAPAEALRPVLGPNFNPNPAVSRPSNGHRHPSQSGSEASSTVGTYFSQSNPSQFPVYSSAQAPIASMPEGLPFGSQQSPVSPTFQSPNNPQMSSMTVPQVSGENPDFTAAFFDPSNPAIFNFNLDGLNFGSQYGAMEWGMLGHMSSGAAETPPRDNSMSQQGAGESNYRTAGNFGHNGVTQFDKVYDSGTMGDFLGLDQQANGLYSQGNLQHGLPHAYAIAAGPTSLQSPSTENNSPQPTTFGFEGSPTMATYSTTPGPGNQPVQHPRPKPKPPKPPNLSKLSHHSMLGKRQRDPSFIYDTVKEPFPYVKSFHKLTELLKLRLPSAKTLRVAKSLASIRPSFISCTRTLNTQDLVFMEKSFQRALFEYEEFMHQCSSPAIICRRTGEVAGVNKEFTAVTGWSKEILLGKERNLNVNNGMAASSTSGGSGPLTTPKMRPLDADKEKSAASDEEPRPVFLAELMDNDSVLEFYEDYSHLAFNDSRGKTVRTCRLLKYRTQESLESAAGSNPSPESPQKVDPRRSILSNRVAKIDGEHGISRLERDGKLDCTYTWTIKRDTFDIPMLIVINFLPRSSGMLAV